MSHPDKCWRVGAIHRCCVRYNKEMHWAKQQLESLQVLSSDGKVIAGHSFPRLAEIWFHRTNPTSINHIEIERHEYRKRKASSW